MNQTKKRLSIINLAISIGDIETIQLQILKLSPLKSDERIQEIIRGLQAENYAQTQALITTYIETPTEEIVQRAIQHEVLTPEEEEEIIEEFDLFKVKPEEEEKEVEEILDLESFAPSSSSKKEEHPVDYDALLNIKEDDILPDNITIKETTLPKEDDFFEKEKNTTFDYTDVIEKDDFFDNTNSSEAVPEHTPDIDIDELTWAPKEEETKTEKIDPVDVMPETEHDFPKKQQNSSQKEGRFPKESHKKREPRPVKDEEPTEYAAITYIDQKFKNMLTQYPPLQNSEEQYASVNAWLMKISNEGYTEKEIEEMITYIQKLDKEGKRAEAAQLLLITAATQSKFAQFMLARSLFKGDLLEKNLPEAFTLINRLAMDDDYAEAICDLGQLYEYGVGIDKDKKRAESLYKEAMELGIKRAREHYERIRKENKKLFSFFRL